MTPRRVGLYAVLALCVGTFAYFVTGAPPEIERCERFTPVNQPLIAHAGGGLPNAAYTNGLEALELAASHGFHLIELDFRSTPEGVAFGHDPKRLSPLTFDQLMAFLRRNPRVSIVTDFKSDNVAGLRRLAELAGAERNRFVPQIYRFEELQPVTDMGYPRPILSVYRDPDFGWPIRANNVPVRAVTMPYRLRYLAGLIDHPVYLHTVNQAVPGYGLYTDCLIPANSTAT